MHFGIVLTWDFSFSSHFAYSPHHPHYTENILFHCAMTGYYSPPPNVDYEKREYVFSFFFLLLFRFSAVY